MCISTSHLHACFHDDLDCAQLMCLNAMPQPLVTPYAMLDDNTCWVNPLLNAWFCTNANHICFSKCLLSLLLLKESLDGATLESAHFELQDDECLVIDRFDMATPSLSHGDLAFDPRSDLFQGGGDDTVYPMDITMSRVCLGSDTCDLYFSYIKVNHLLYTCSLDPFEDGILLDTPLVCMHRYCRSFTDDEEECKRQGSPTPSAREAWKRRRKKRSCCKLQAPDDRRLPDVRRVPGDRTTGGHRTSVTSATEPKSRKLPEVRELPDVRSLPSHRTSGVQRTTGTCLRTVFGPAAHVSLSPLTYPLVAINSSTSTILGLALV